jgi:predicted ATP-grasp superfamily ATP-dependent carboligase
MRVLISDRQDWRADIRQGFNHTRHHVEFGAITPGSLGSFDLVVPLSIQDLVRVCRHSRLLTKNRIPVPSEECVLLCDDKYRFNQELVNLGFGRYIPKIGSGLEPPYILKKRVGEWGNECRMILSSDEENQVLSQLNDPEYFCQEIIPGEIEFATHILFANNRIIKSLNIMYEFDSETAIKGQAPALYKMIHRCAYLDLFADILKAIGFQGLCCVNYKVAGGQPYILEINPRFGGSLSPYFFSFVRHLS